MRIKFSYFFVWIWLFASPQRRGPIAVSYHWSLLMQPFQFNWNFAGRIRTAPVFSLSSSGWRSSDSGYGGERRHTVCQFKAPLPSPLPVRRGEGVSGSARMRPILHGFRRCRAKQNRRDGSDSATALFTFGLRFVAALRAAGGIRAAFHARRMVAAATAVAFHRRLVAGCAAGRQENSRDRHHRQRHYCFHVWLSFPVDWFRCRWHPRMPAADYFNSRSRRHAKITGVTSRPHTRMAARFRLAV